MAGLLKKMRLPLAVLPKVVRLSNYLGRSHVKFALVPIISIYVTLAMEQKLTPIKYSLCGAMVPILDCKSEYIAHA